MSAPQGLVNSLNRIRELSSDIYHQYVPAITEDTDIATFGNPILSVPAVQNEFMSALVNRIVYTQFEVKYFRNPLEVLKGDRLPLGYAGQSIYVNPAKARKFNVEDFAGLLAKYEAKTKVQYDVINTDLQYPVTVSRQTLKKAFVSWDALDSFIDQLSQSLYNGAYIDEYQYIKGLVSGAYKGVTAPIEVISAPTTEALAKEFTTKARTLFLNFQSPSTDYNAWNLVGDGEKITTWTNPEDIVMIIRNDVRSFLDVNVLAQSFNMSSAELMGNIISVDNFDQYDTEGHKIFDGSKIVAILADKSWFKVKDQDMFLDEFYNPNNRTFQYYLNKISMYSRSLFANGVIFATEAPVVKTQALSYGDTETIEVEVGDTEGLDLVVTPLNANEAIEYDNAGADSVFTVEADPNDPRHCYIKGVGDGDGTLTVTSGDAEVQVAIKVGNGSIVI